MHSSNSLFSSFFSFRYSAAEADCNKCLKLDPKYIKAYLRRGSSRIKLGKPEEAREDFRKVRRRNWLKVSFSLKEMLVNTLSNSAFYHLLTCKLYILHNMQKPPLFVLYVVLLYWLLYYMWNKIHIVYVIYDLFFYMTLAL